MLTISWKLVRMVVEQGVQLHFRAPRSVSQAIRVSCLKPSQAPFRLQMGVLASVRAILHQRAQQQHSSGSGSSRDSACTSLFGQDDGETQVNRPTV
jgi:hypothetical protein